METRKAQEARIKGGTVLPDDVSNAMAFVNRLRSAFSWIRGLDASAPLDETTLDGLLIVKASVQSVASSTKSAESNIRDFVIARADAGDGLFEPSTETDTLFLGLDTHAKRFSVERQVRPYFDKDAFIRSLVEDGVLTQDECDERSARFTETPTIPVVRFIKNSRTS